MPATESRSRGVLDRPLSLSSGSPKARPGGGQRQPFLGLRRAPHPLPARALHPPVPMAWRPWASITRSTQLTIFWHCGFRHFSFRTGAEVRLGNHASMVLAEDRASKGSGNADSQRNGWSSGWGGQRRAYPRDSGCVLAHPASRRASASYLPLRAVWAVCAWALRGCARSPGPFSFGA